MSGKWYQLYVKAPEGNGYTTPKAMKRVDDHLLRFGANMYAPPPEGMPAQEADGTWGVRVHAAQTLPLIKRILIEHYGLEIVREEGHDPATPDATDKEA